VIVMALTDPDRQKLTKLAGLLGSAHDGEIINAARLAQRVLTAAGATWAELINPPAPVPLATPAAIDLARMAQLERDAFERGRKAGLAEQQSQQQQHFTSWPVLADHCLHQHDRLLTAFERDFLHDFLARRWTTPTVKQHRVFATIASRVGISLPAHSRPGSAGMMWGPP
jgi:hypothetical protein